MVRKQRQELLVFPVKGEVLLEGWAGPGGQGGAASPSQEEAWGGAGPISPGA